jgi:ArsR family metal-binding transcriptional regulator
MGEQPEAKEVLKTRDEEMGRLKVTLNDLFANVTYHGRMNSIQFKYWILIVDINGKS